MMFNTLNGNKTRDNIITAAQELIKTTGFEDFTLDNVANEMHIPKQTIYDFFCDNAQLVEMLIAKQVEQTKKTLQRVRMNATNSVEQVFLGWNVVSEFFKIMKSEAMNQLKRNYTPSFKLVNEFKNVFLYNYFKLNIDTGITQEVYRHNIKTELLSRYLIEILQVPLMSSISHKNRYGSAEAEDQLMTYHLYGIATEKGIKLIRKYKNEFLAYTSPFQ